MNKMHPHTKLWTKGANLKAKHLLTSCPSTYNLYL